MFNPQTGMFDATGTAPDQGMPTHPVGKFQAQISATEKKATKAADGYYLDVEFITPAGKIRKGYNFWNQNAQAVEISGKQFSALCYATGIHRTNIEMGAPELRGAYLQIEVGHQRNNKDLTEVSKVFTPQGIEPGGKTGAPQGQPMQQPQQQAFAPPQGQPNQGWGAPQPGQQPPMQPQQPQQGNFPGAVGPAGPAPQQGSWPSAPGGGPMSPSAPGFPGAPAGGGMPAYAPQPQQGGFQPPAGNFQPPQGQPPQNGPAAAPGWSQQPGGQAPQAQWNGPR